MSCSRLTLTMPLRSTLAGGARKGLSTAPVAVREVGRGQQSTKVTTLPSGLTLVSVPSPNAYACALGVCIRAGSRYENYDNAGASHVLRNALGSSTSGNFDRVALSKTLEFLGTNTVCKSDRDYVFYAMTPTREKLDEALDYFLDASTNLVFKRHELMRQFPRLEREVLMQDANSRATELLHRAAYRNGLGNTVICPNHMLNRHTAEIMMQFYKDNFRMGDAALVGVGLDIDTLEDCAPLVKLPEGKATAPTKTTYYGGELRQDANTPNAIVLLGNQVAGWSGDVKEPVSVFVLKHILGYETEGLSSNSPLEDAMGGLAHATPFAHVYSDSGLFGISLDVSANQAGKAVEKAAALLRSMTVTAEQVEIGKSRLLSEVYNIGSDPLAYAEDQAVQAVLAKSVVDVGQANAMLKTISLADVQAVAKKLGSGKLTMASYGNLKTVPYLDSL